MDALWGILLLMVLMVIGVPVAWSFAAVLAYLTVVYDANLNTLMLQGYRSIDSVILLALPLFVLTGYLMQSGGIARRLVAFIQWIVGDSKGGLGASVIFTSAVFGAIAGTATAAVASIGTIMSGPMEERGYPRGYTAALLGISSLLGILIPPSITMILFAVMTRQSVAACFAATIGPGLLLIGGLAVVNRISAGRLFHETPIPAGPKESGLALTIGAMPALCLPVIILGGIYGGVFTPTEAAAVAVFAAFFVGGFVYRELNLARLTESIIGAAETTGSIILILLFSFMISRIMAAERVPQELTEAVTAVVQDPVLVLLLVNAVLVVAGMIMDDLTVTVVIAPLLLPVVAAAGVDPIHYAAIVGCSVVVAANSPPVAPILYMACRVGRVSVHKALLPAIVMLLTVALPVALITTFVPGVALYIPRLLGFL
jgi:tripartite ATP-independent transporter DctM subunit